MNQILFTLFQLLSFLYISGQYINLKTVYSQGIFGYLNEE